MGIFDRIFGKGDYRKNVRHSGYFKCPHCKSIFQKSGELLDLSFIDSGRDYMLGNHPLEQERVDCPKCRKELNAKWLVQGFYDASEYDVLKARGCL